MVSTFAEFWVKSSLVVYDYRRGSPGARGHGAASLTRHAGRSREGKTTMTDDPVELDEHRGMTAQKSTEIRRRRHAVKADLAALQRRQEEFECHAVAAASANWPEAAVKARYLIELFAATPEARNPRRRELIVKVLEDFARLSRLSEGADSTKQ
jgi:hypothetical protein